MGIAPQKDMIGKTDDEKAKELSVLKHAVGSAAGLPSRATDLVGMLDGVSKAELQSLVQLGNAAVVRTRLLVQIAKELAA